VAEVKPKLAVNGRGDSLIDFGRPPEYELDRDHLLPNDITQQTYQQTAESYIERTPGVGGPRQEFLDRVLHEVGVSGSVLEIGSGPGVDADYLEAGGLTVLRTDATRAFVDRLRAAGHRAERLDVRVDDLGGPWDAVFANAVLLHLSREDFTAAVSRIRTALRTGGLFAFTLKAGDGEGWSERKLQQPRYFVYWKADSVRAVLTNAGWSTIEVTQPDYPVGSDPWLHVLARA
jgi:SAM-dependent methyltransferase